VVEEPGTPADSDGASFFVPAECAEQEEQSEAELNSVQGISPQSPDDPEDRGAIPLTEARNCLIDHVAPANPYPCLD
jgi:hypothetical protein